MATAKLFQNGSSQAIRLPKEFRIQGNEVKIFKHGNQVYIGTYRNDMELIVRISQ